MAKFNRATKKEFKLDDITYYYWTVGDPKNNPLFIFPGFTGDHSDQLEFANYLKEKYFVIIPDFPGWGKSPRLKMGMTIESYARFCHLLLEKDGTNKVTLLGHCMGTATAILYVLTYPEQVNVQAIYLENGIASFL